MNYVYLSESKNRFKSYKRAVLVSMLTMATILVSALKQDCEDSVEVSAVSQSHITAKAIVHAGFLDILERTEGYREDFYPDNEGIATMYAWNISKNDKRFNQQIIRLLDIPPRAAKAIEKYSGQDLNSVPVELKNFKIKKQQSLMAVDFMYRFYLDEFLRALVQKTNNPVLAENFSKTFNEEQQAVFAHMAYKVGRTNLLKYDNFYQNLGHMLSKNHIDTSDMARLASEMSYEFKYKGKTLRDARVEAIHRSILLKG